MGGLHTDRGCFESTIAPLMQWKIARARQMQLLSTLQESAIRPRVGLGRIVFTQPQHEEYLRCLRSAENSVPFMPYLTTAGKAKKRSLEVYGLHPLCVGYMELLGSSVDRLQLLTGILTAAFSELGWTTYRVPVITGAWLDGKVVDPKTFEEVESTKLNSEQRKEQVEVELMTAQDPLVQTQEEHRSLDVIAHRIVILGHSPTACACINIKADENILVKRPMRRASAKGMHAAPTPSPVESATATGAIVTAIKCTSSGLGCHAHRLRAHFMDNVSEAVMELGDALYKEPEREGGFAFE